MVHKIHASKVKGFTRKIFINSCIDAFKKLNPRFQVRNPVMFIVYIFNFFILFLYLQTLLGEGEAHPAFIGSITAWLWFTILFANFSEALAESRGKAQAESLKRLRTEVKGKKLKSSKNTSDYELVSSTDLQKDDLIFVEKDDIIPLDGDVVQGIAYVDESAITGESAPVIRESGGDRSAVTGGTKVISDWIIIKITARPGEGFLDYMISLVEGAKRQKTPNEIALHILLSGLSIIFLVVCATLLPFSIYSVEITSKGSIITLTALISLLVCLIPTTIGGLASAVGISGIDRLLRRNIIAMSGRAIEAAGDINVLLLDKTGTITLGNREAVEFIPLENHSVNEIAELAQLASLADETPEGRSIVVLAKDKYNIRAQYRDDYSDKKHKFIPFSAQTRMSGVDINSIHIRKGALDSIIKYTESLGSTNIPSDLKEKAQHIAKEGGTPLVISHNQDIVGIIHLKDVVKGSIKERFMQLRHMGIKTIMITGDNPITAAAIAAESGVDDFLAEATPEDKLKLIRKYQAQGNLIAMAGDGTNDAPALAQADVAVAMNTGTQHAREAANMIDLDSNPTKLIEIVEIGKQLLMTRGALTTFSIANDVAKYFAILPAAFAATYPQLLTFNIMKLSTPHSAILSAVIFNALIIIALIPLALKGVRYRPIGAAKLLRNNLLIYGIGGLIAPFVGIKLIDLIISHLNFV